MGKRITVVVSATFFAVYAYANEPLFDYKQLDGDSANYAFINRFSDSRVFNCYNNGKVVFGIGVNALFKGSESSKKVEEQYIKKYHTPFDWDKRASYIRIEAGFDTNDGFKPTYISAGKPLFDSNDHLKYMAVELLNGKKVEFARFGPIPDFPFNTRKKLKPFFYYQVEGEQRYECGAINQPD